MTSPTISLLVGPLLLVALVSSLPHKCMIQPDADGRVVVPDTVTSIGDSAFIGCTSLVSVAISDSVMKVGVTAFAACTNLVSVVLPTSVTDIGDGAFPNCLGFGLMNASSNASTTRGNISCVPCNDSHVTVPDTVTSIRGAFYRCTNVVSAAISDSVTTMFAAFVFANNLVSVVIPDSVTTVSNSFHNCLGFGLMLSAGNNSRGAVECVPCNSSRLVVPNSVVSMSGAFSYCASLVSVVIPDSVVNITGSFIGCSSLSSVHIANTVRNLVGVNFPNCFGYGLHLARDNHPVGGVVECLPCNRSRVVIPDIVTAIYEYAFASCSNLETIAIPNSITAIGSSAFESCESLNNVVLPASVTNIEDFAFSGCTSLASVAIPASVTDLDAAAFFMCACPMSAYRANVTLCNCSPGTCLPPHVPASRAPTTASPTPPAAARRQWITMDAAVIGFAVGVAVSTVGAGAVWCRCKRMKRAGEASAPPYRAVYEDDGTESV